VGVSYGDVLNGTKPASDRKLPLLFRGLSEKYSGDFKVLFPTLKAILNDAPAGLISGAIESNRAFGAKNILFAINGSGLNVAACVSGQIFGSESGHVKSAEQLNRFDQTEPCGVNGATYVCIQSLGSNKYGIESQWLARTTEPLPAKEIENRYKAGDKFAGELYEHSAFVVAHMIAGSSNVFGLNLADNDAALVCHGGAFRFPGYGERVTQILNKHYGSSVKTVLTKDYVKSANACLEGAAIAALTA
jgi:predicted NBD/HSP70 family sugar kinase